MGTQIIAQRHKYQLLLVDDDEDEQLLFAHQFADTPMELTMYTSGWDALNYLKGLPRNELPSLVVLDYNMPGWNGAEVLMRLKQNDKLGHIPVIIYSSEMTPRLRNELLDLGALRCFQKGSDVEEMKEYLNILNVVFTNSVFN